MVHLSKSRARIQLDLGMAWNHGLQIRGTQNMSCYSFCSLYPCDFSLNPDWWFVCLFLKFPLTLFKRTDQPRQEPTQPIGFRGRSRNSPAQFRQMTCACHLVLYVKGTPGARWLVYQNVNDGLWGSSSQESTTEQLWQTVKFTKAVKRPVCSLWQCVADPMLSFWSLQRRWWGQQPQCHLVACQAPPPASG